MINAQTKKIINVLQSLYQEHHKQMKVIFKGEEAVLFCLYKKFKQQDVTPSEISEELNISTARVAASLNRMQAKELITREIDPDDRRKIIIKLTEKGIHAAESLKENQLAKINVILTKLGEQKVAELLTIIEKINLILKEEKENA